MIKNEKIEPELINVHKIFGGKEVVRFLKNSGHDFVEGLFYKAKHEGISTFVFADVPYEMIRNNDGSFTVREQEDIDFSTESLA
jgi:hypothetical protein